MPRRFNASPRPRLLLIGLTEDERAAIADVFESVRTADFAADVSLADFDLLVTDEPSEFEGASRWVNGIFVARSPDDEMFAELGSFNVAFANMRQQAGVTLSRRTRSIEFSSDDGIPAVVEPLLDELARTAAATVERGVDLAGWALWPEHAFEVARTATLPFLVGSDGTIVAGSLALDEHEEVWFIQDTSQIVEWVVAACTHWSTTRPDRFPLTADQGAWWRDPRWATAEESRLVSEQDDFARRRAEALAKLDTEATALTDQLEAVAAGIDVGERRLLTAQGDQLHDETRIALERFGFRVVNMDAGRREHEQMLEDLRVYDPADDSWVAVAEVRGYKAGAKATDLSGKIRRFREHFAADQGRSPSATWYIVNHHIGQSPETRPQVLQGADADVRTFAEHADGAVIETAQLYDLLRQVERGDINAADVRRRLRDARGRLVLSEGDDG